MLRSFLIQTQPVREQSDHFVAVAHVVGIANAAHGCGQEFFEVGALAFDHGRSRRHADKRQINFVGDVEKIF